MPRLKTAIPWSALTTSSPGTGKPASALPNVSELDAYGIKDPQPANERVKGASLGATLTLRRPVAKLRGDFSTHARLGKLGCRIQVARDGQHARAAERGGVLGSRPSPCGRHRGYLEPIPRRASFQGRHQSPGCVARSSGAGLPPRSPKCSRRADGARSSGCRVCWNRNASFRPNRALDRGWRHIHEQLDVHTLEGLVGGESNRSPLNRSKSSANLAHGYSA